jgi:hypothetical protein
MYIAEIPGDISCQSASPVTYGYFSDPDGYLWKVASSSSADQADATE